MTNAARIAEAEEILTRVFGLPGGIASPNFGYRKEVASEVANLLAQIAARTAEVDRVERAHAESLTEWAKERDELNAELEVAVAEVERLQERIAAVAQVVEAARESDRLTWNAGTSGEYGDVAIRLRDTLAAYNRLEGGT